MLEKFLTITRIESKIFKGILIFIGIVLAAGLSVLSLVQFSPQFSSLPRVTKASFGHDGDPINLAILGDKYTITKAFLAAHWLIPDSINKITIAKIISASITDSSYPNAPVSNLYLFDRAHDLAFEYPTNTVRKRHHVRLWETQEIVSGKMLWLGSATFDSGIKLSGTDAFPTHHIDPNIDNERDFLVKSLVSTGLIQSISLERNVYPTLWGFNGGGDWYFDDGLIRLFILK